MFRTQRERRVPNRLKDNNDRSIIKVKKRNATGTPGKEDLKVLGATAKGTPADKARKKGAVSPFTYNMTGEGDMEEQLERWMARMARMV